MKKQQVYIIVPFGYGAHKFKLSKARRWGAIDKILLEFIAKKPSTAHELSTLSSLPRQLIIEILIPLMQAGWIEIINSNGEYRFKTTDRGLVAASNEELPVENEPMTRVRSFLIDPITNECYRTERKRKYQLFNRHGVLSASQNFFGRVAELKVKGQYLPELTDIFDCITYEDEEVNGIEDGFIRRNYSDKLKYAIATIDSDDNISGIPYISDELKNEILTHAEKLREKIYLSKTQQGDEAKVIPYYYSQKSIKTFSSRIVKNENIKLICGPTEHYNHIYNIIYSAKTRVIIHSTFINENCIKTLYPLFINAVQRSVQIDILWGQTEPENEDRLEKYKKTIEILKHVQDDIDSKGFTTLFRFHISPTHSHSKFIIYDSEDGEFNITIGSCNWLSSNFNRYEVSANIKNDIVTSDLLQIASHLSMSDTGVSNNLSREFSILATKLKTIRENASTVSDKNHSSIKIVSAPEHHLFSKLAADTALNEIFICSHRVNYAGDRPVIKPLLAAIGVNKNIKISVSYGRSSTNMKNGELQKLKDMLSREGMNVIKADDPQIHAKVLSWDRDNVIITSLNWLSASSKGDDYNELGMYINSKNIFEEIEKSFHQMYK